MHSSPSVATEDMWHGENNSPPGRPRRLSLITPENAAKEERSLRLTSSGSQNTRRRQSISSRKQQFLCSGKGDGISSFRSIPNIGVLRRKGSSSVRNCVYTCAREEEKDGVSVVTLEACGYRRVERGWKRAEGGRRSW